MKNFARALLVVGFVAGALWLGAGGLSSESKVVATPPLLNVAGESGTKITRALTLKATSLVTDVHVTVTDLTAQDGRAAIPFQSVSVSMTSNTLTPNQPAVLPIEISLCAFEHDTETLGDVCPPFSSAGKFDGQLFITYFGGELNVPISASVKSGWLVPLALLLSGIGLGLVLNLYRAQGAPRDTVRVQSDLLLTQLRSDDAFTNTDGRPVTKAFHDHIVGKVGSADFALDVGDLTKAQTSIEDAKKVWLSWRFGRPDWLAQEDFAATLERDLGQDDPDTTSTYLRSVRDALQRACDGAPQLEQPSKLQESLKAIAANLAVYAGLRRRLSTLDDSIANMDPSDEKLQFEQTADGLRDDLEALTPGDAAKAQDLDKRIKDELVSVSAEAAKKHTEQAGERDLPGALGGGEAEDSAARQPPTPTVTAWDALALPKAGASSRLKWAAIASFVVAWVLLAGAAFNELYIKNATFGSFADYLALFVAGFGIEASRAAITNFANNTLLGGGNDGGATKPA